MSKIFGGPRALGENRKILKFFIFLLTNPTFSSSIWIVHVLSFHLRCITPLKLKILKILNFSTIISIEICRPLATKQRDLKMFKMASQVVFRPKNVPRFIRVTTSFQSPGRIGLKHSLSIKTKLKKCSRLWNIVALLRCVLKRGQNDALV